MNGEDMTDQEARDEAVHWVGDAPTSLHGNGAASFERTTRDPGGVTCKLCLSELRRDPPAVTDQEARDERERESLALAIDPNALEVSAYPWPLDAADRVYAWMAENGYRKQPEPEWEMGSTCGICDEVHALDEGETPEPGRLLYHRQVGPWEQVDQ